MQRHPGAGETTASPRAENDAPAAQLAAAFAGRALRPLSPALLQPGLNAAMAIVRRGHPRVFERLSGLASPRYRIDPVELPIMFLLDATAARPRLVALRRGSAVAAAATIRGSLVALLSLLQGNVDGDALFFSRDLTIEGDTEAVVALRNALDDAEIDLLDDIVAALGPFGHPARLLVGRLAGLAHAFGDDLEPLRQALVAPLARRVDGHAARLDRLDQRLASSTAAARRSPARAS